MTPATVPAPACAASPPADHAGDAHPLVPYRTYWIAWGVLLGLTFAMVFSQSPAVLIAGMVVKASIIGLLFMHLWFESLDFTLTMIVAILGLSLLLFGLMIPDGLAM